MTAYRPSSTTVCPMITYEKLDSWKACHALTLATFEMTKPLLKVDLDAADRLRLSALLSAAKLARGAGTGNKRMFHQCAELSAGHLSEFGYHLKLTRVMGLIPDASCDMLDALRGRAAFYVWKHLFGALPLPEIGPPEDPEAGASAA